MNGLFLLIVLNVDNVSENGKEFFQKLWVWVDSCTMNWRAVIVPLVMIDRVELFKLVDN